MRYTELVFRTSLNSSSMLSEYGAGNEPELQSTSTHKNARVIIWVEESMNESSIYV
jgi:hypothetical protein